jgi:peptidoglycan hydrolase CwlO-like protein
MLGRLLTFALLSAFLVSVSLAQSQDNPPSQTPGPSSSSPDSTATPPTPKKVWTNEDMSSVKGGVSVVGKRNQNYKLTPAQTADPATVDRFKKGLQKLQTQLDDVNAKLASYKQFQEGEHVSTGERDMSKAYSRTPVDQQIAQLQKKQTDLTTQIGDLLDEARKKGIDSSQLR